MIATHFGCMAMCMPLFAFLGGISLGAELAVLFGGIVAGEVVVYLVLTVAGSVIGWVADRLETREINYL